MIQPFSIAHINQVARLHCAGVPSLLKELGEPAAKAFYTGCGRSELAVGFVDMDGDAVRGFVLGAEHPDQLRTAVVTTNPLGTLVGVALGVARRPKTFVSVLGSLGGSNPHSFDRSSPELIYLAVDDTSQGSGIGRHLVEAFSGELERRGVTHYELSVGANNGNAIAFYRRLGFEQIAEYQEFGSHHFRLAKELKGMHQAAP